MESEICLDFGEVSKTEVVEFDETDGELGESKFTDVGCNLPVKESADPEEETALDLR